MILNKFLKIFLLRLNLYLVSIWIIIADIFFPKGDSPAVIELPHKAQERIDLVHQYVGDDGTLLEDEPSILSDVNKLEELLLQQEGALNAENKEKELYKRFGLW